MTEGSTVSAVTYKSTVFIYETWKIQRGRKKEEAGRKLFEDASSPPGRTTEKERATQHYCRKGRAGGRKAGEWQGVACRASLLLNAACCSNILARALAHFSTQ